MIRRWRSASTHESFAVIGVGLPAQSDDEYRAEIERVADRFRPLVLRCKERGVAILSQSGNMGINFTMQRRGLPIAYLLSLGNPFPITGRSRIGAGALRTHVQCAARIHKGQTSTSCPHGVNIYDRQAQRKAGDLAPDFTLYDISGIESVTLSDFRGKKPVVLIFGSYT